MPETITMPDGSERKLVYECANCGHTSDSHKGRQVGHDEKAVCEACGRATLLQAAGAPVEPEEA